MIHVECIEDTSSKLIDAFNISFDQLPNRFDSSSKITIRGTKWSVVSAVPDSAIEFLALGRLTLRLHKVETIDPRQILFSLPTICDFIPGLEVDSVPDSAPLEIHEDDWRQAEIVSASYEAIIDEEFAEVLRIHTKERVGSAFRALHVRKKIVAPIEPCSATLAQLFECFPDSRPYAGVTYWGAKELIKSGFAVATHSGTELYGCTDAGVLTTLCLQSCRDPAGVAHDMKALGRIWDLSDFFLVDWCRAERRRLNELE